jgi:hypothetical protein
MKAPLYILSIFCAAVLFAPAFPARAAAPKAPVYQLSITLRDGSRLVGTKVKPAFHFHSTLLGDLSLSVTNIRSLDDDATNAVRLLTTGGDTLTTAFADSSFAVNTSFGKVELQSDSVSKLTVTAIGLAGQGEPGLVALWSGEDSPRDSVGGNDLEPTDILYADGQVGRAFALNGVSSYLKLTDTPNLDVGKGDGMTISFWLRPNDVVNLHPLIEWNPSNKLPGKLGVSIQIGRDPGSRGVVLVNINSLDQQHFMITSDGVLTAGVFQQLTMTYDKTTGTGVLYLNGVVVAIGNWPPFDPLTTGDLWISSRPTDHPGDWTNHNFYSGLLDEIAIYNRALSATEVQALCTEQNHGVIAARPGSPIP